MLSAEDTAAEIKRIINDDPTIPGARYILVFASKKGFGPFKKEEIHLSGIVHSEADKKKAEELAKHSAGVLPVINEIEVAPAGKK